MITTHNLQLIVCERMHIAAFLRGRNELAAILQVKLPDSWPHFPEVFTLPAGDTPNFTPPLNDWNGHFFIHPKKSVLVGNGGFHGQPDDKGVVEIGYEIAPEYQNMGFATEAARGLIDYAFAHPEIQAVIAHTLAEKNPSNSVLQKVGMKFVEEFELPEDGKLWRWQISRDDYHL